MLENCGIMFKIEILDIEIVIGKVIVLEIKGFVGGGDVMEFLVFVCCIVYDEILKVIKFWGEFV